MSIELLRCSVVSIVGIELSWLTQCTGPRRWTTSLRPENGADAKLGPHAAQGGPRTEPINALKNINKQYSKIYKFTKPFCRLSICLLLYMEDQDYACRKAVVIRDAERKAAGERIVREQFEACSRALLSALNKNLFEWRVIILFEWRINEKDFAVTYLFCQSCPGL